MFVEPNNILLVDSGMNVEDQEPVLKYCLNQEFYQGSFSNARLTHNDDGNMGDCTLNNQAHLKEIVESNAVVSYFIP